MRSPEAWTRKRMGEAHATHRSRTTGVTGARKSEATMTGRHAALHARERRDSESGQDGQDSAVGTPVSPTASEKAEVVRHTYPCPCLPFRALYLCRPADAEAADLAPDGRVADGAGEGQERGAGRRLGRHRPGLQGAALLRQHLREPAADAARCAPHRQAGV
eukprot:6192150-Pleurochrysis_carterae.AAC.1